MPGEQVVVGGCQWFARLGFQRRTDDHGVSANLYGFKDSRDVFPFLKEQFIFGTNMLTIVALDLQGLVIGGGLVMVQFLGTLGLLGSKSLKLPIPTTP